MGDGWHRDRLEDVGENGPLGETRVLAVRMQDESMGKNRLRDGLDGIRCDV